MRQHLCGWACKCFLTRLNFVIAGCILTLVLYVLSETTYLFETISHFFTGLTIQRDPRGGDKSIEKFIDSHYTLLLLIVPCIFAAILTVHSMSHYSDELIAWCSCKDPQQHSSSRQSIRAPSSSSHRHHRQPQIKRPAAPAPMPVIETIAEASPEEEDHHEEANREKIRNRKKTPGPRRGATSQSGV